MDFYLLICLNASQSWSFRSSATNIKSGRCCAIMLNASLKSSASAMTLISGAEFRTATRLVLNNPGFATISNDLRRLTNPGNRARINSLASLRQSILENQTDLRLCPEFQTPSEICQRCANISPPSDLECRIILGFVLAGSAQFLQRRFDLWIVHRTKHVPSEFHYAIRLNPAPLNAGSIRQTKRFFREP